ncbi:hypothetical protein M514_18069 [Trichuris suis]|uniref:DDE-1 domain-containing protein n=1 Tax=Trichuris suis TaxID=68888 RepID=A0A085NJN8_9BILA|nr:hypothetical protein M514_18069 [Trichuris suis]
MTPLDAARVTRTRSSVMENTERLLNIWIEDLHQRNCPCSLMAIQMKVLTPLEDLKKKEGSSAESETFTASRGSDRRYTLKEFWLGYRIMNAIENLAAAWHEVKRSTMNLAWRKICPEAIAELTVLEQRLQNVHRELGELANEAGFSDIIEEDILELLESRDEELSNKDLMEMEQQLAEEEESDKTKDAEQARTSTTKDLSEAFQLLDRAMAIFTDKDPQRERSAKVIG